MSFHERHETAWVGVVLLAIGVPLAVCLGCAVASMEMFTFQTGDPYSMWNWMADKPRHTGVSPIIWRYFLAIPQLLLVYYLLEAVVAPFRAFFNRMRPGRNRYY